METWTVLGSVAFSSDELQLSRGQSDVGQGWREVVLSRMHLQRKNLEEYI